MGSCGVLFVCLLLMCCFVVNLLCCCLNFFTLQFRVLSPFCRVEISANKLEGAPLLV